MSVLWITFCQKLTGMGYSSSDLHHCSEAVFLSIVDDMQAFTPLQISALVQEWKGSHTAVKGGSSSNASSIRVIEVRGPDAVGEFSRTDVLNSARKFLRNVSPDGVRLILSVNVNMEVLEVPRHQLQQYQTRRGALFDSSTPPKMCWKLCSPTTIDAILKDYRRSSPHGGFGAELDEDELCSSAIVLYNDDAIEARNVCQEQVSELPHLGWALVGFEVAGGRSRAVTAEELSNLRTFSTMECLEMLDEAGFDSLEVTDRGVMALFHAHQALPRCIVYFDAKLDASHGANGTLENSQRSKSELADPSSGRLPPHPRAQVAEAGWSCPSHAKAVEFWSATEKKLLCSHCLYYGGYSRENCVPINEAVQLVSPSLRQWVHHAETFSQEIDGVMKMFDAAQADLDRSAKTAMKDLHMQLERARSRLDECEAALSHQNDQMYQLGTKSLDQSRQKVVEAVKHIDTLVTQVDGIVSAVEAGRPISSTQSIHLLQHAQTVFGPWQSIAIPAYKAPQLNEAIDRLVDQAVSEITMGDTAGKVELPEAIDVNYLKHGC